MPTPSMCLHQDALESHRRLITTKLPLKCLIRGEEITLYRALTLYAIYYIRENEGRTRNMMEEYMRCLLRVTDSLHLSRDKG